MESHSSPVSNATWSNATEWDVPAVNPKAPGNWTSGVVSVTNHTTDGRSIQPAVSDYISYNLTTDYSLLANHTAPDNSTTNFTVPAGCFLLQFSDYIPWDNPQDFISTQLEGLFDRLRGGFFVPLLFAIGGPANCLNMAVFYRHGLRERVNLCLFALSLADGLYLLQGFILNAERMVTQFTTNEKYGPVYEFLGTINIIGWFGFTWVSQVISAVIASERCFCIVSPLHSQTILKTRTMAVFIVFTFVIIVGVYFVVAFRYRIVCVFDPTTMTAMRAVGGSAFYYRHKEVIDYLDVMVYGIAIPWTSVTIVIITTIVTAVRLRQVVKERASMSSQAISAREVGLTKMLIGHSIVFLACVLPISLFRLGLLLVRDLNAGGRYHNTFLSILWLLEVLSYTNSTCNFFVYYAMGSRYRETLSGILCRGRGAFRRPVTISAKSVSTVIGT